MNILEIDVVEELEPRSDHGKPVQITISMIARRNLPSSVVAKASDELVHKLLKLTHVRLDRENIGEIDNMEVLGPVTNLYLQQNSITKIENLESLMDLRFLVLSGNQICQVENLLLLDQLQFLDLSENSIEVLDPEQFPKSLVILNLTGNPCCESTEYRSSIVQSLPALRQLDGISVSVEEKREAGHEVSLEEEEESSDGLSDEEEDGHRVSDQSYHQALNDVFHLSTKLIKESQQRTLTYRSGHDSKMTDIDDIRSRSRQVMATPEVKPAL